MRSRLVLLLLPIAVLLFLVRPRLPTEVALHVHVGARGAEVRQLDVKFVRDEVIARDLTLHFPAGAPADLDRTVRLAPGDYQIAVRVLDQQGHEARDTQPRHVSGDEPVELDVARLR